MLDLTRGANCPTPSATVTVSVACSSAVDVSALLLADDGRVRSDDDFVFYNNPTGPGVSYLAADVAPRGVDAVRVDTGSLPSAVTKVVVTASLDGATTFAAAGSMVVTVLDADANDAVRYDITDLATETALICVEIYLRNGEWKIRAVGQGYASGLAGIAADFGISVDDGAQEPPPSPGTTAPPSAAAPVPTPAQSSAPAPIPGPPAPSIALLTPPSVSAPPSPPVPPPPYPPWPPSQEPEADPPPIPMPELLTRVPGR